MVDKLKAEKCARAAKKAKAVQAVVCYSGACSLAEMQPDAAQKAGCSKRG